MNRKYEQSFTKDDRRTFAQVLGTDNVKVLRETITKMPCWTAEVAFLRLKI